MLWVDIMATTEIHKVTSTPNNALSYAISDKMIELEKMRETLDEIEYKIVEVEGKEYAQFITINSYHNCNVLDPNKTFSELQEKWQNVRYNNNGTKAKGGEPLMWHLHQSFNGFEVSPNVANEIGLKLAQRVFSNFAVTISTHTNTANIHNHFIISAWDNEGKKWNNCNSNYQLIRSISDELCREYGLHVLENTSKVKLIKWEDVDGNIHYYEPTDRKNDLIREREAGKISTDDINSYRNTNEYEVLKQVKIDNRTEIKNDIDSLLPICRNFDELLERLRDLGYSIRDKKKNGDWLSHISYKSPTQDKATREDKIGDGEFYLRENLEKYLAEKNRTIQVQEITSETNHREDNFIYVPEAEYGNFDLSQLDYEYKIVRGEFGEKIAERTETEKKVVSDILAADVKVKGLIDTTRLHEIIKEHNVSRKRKQPYISKSEEERLVSQIQSSFRCLKYTETHNIYSYEQIIRLYSVSKEKYDTAIGNFAFAEQSIEKLKATLDVPKKLFELENKIESKRNDVGYILEEYIADKKQCEEYKELLVKYKIDTQKGLENLQSKVADFEARQEINRGYMSNVLRQMSELENCIRTFDRIDSEHGLKNNRAMQEFESIVIESVDREKEKKNEQDNKGRKGDR